MGWGVIGDFVDKATDVVNGTTDVLDSATDHTVSAFNDAISDSGLNKVASTGMSIFSSPLAGPNVVDPRVASGIEDFTSGVGDAVDAVDGFFRGRGRQEAVTGPDGIDGERRSRDVGRVDGATGDRLGGVGVDFTSDAQGRELLDHYLTAGGDSLDIVDDPSWSDYMRTQLGANDRGVPFDDQVIDELSSGDLAVGRSGSFAAETTNGEGITGVNYLHGTNEMVGGLEYEILGVREGEDGSTIVETRLTWNDRIDANGQYRSDQVKNAFAEVITLGRAEAYDLSITWNEEFVIAP